MKVKETILSIFSTTFRVVLIVIGVMFIIKYSVKGYDYAYRLFGEKPLAEPGYGVNISITITGDMNTKDIGKVLEQKGLIRDHTLFWTQEKLSGHRGEIKPGSYDLNTAMTVEEMMTVMSQAPEAETLYEKYHQEANPEQEILENSEMGQQENPESENPDNIDGTDEE